MGSLQKTAKILVPFEELWASSRSFHRLWACCLLFCSALDSPRLLTQLLSCLWFCVLPAPDARGSRSSSRPHRPSGSLTHSQSCQLSGSHPVGRRVPVSSAIWFLGLVVHLVLSRFLCGSGSGCNISRVHSLSDSQNRSLFCWLSGSCPVSHLVPGPVSCVSLGRFPCGPCRSHLRLQGVPGPHLL